MAILNFFFFGLPQLCQSKYTDRISFRLRPLPSKSFPSHRLSSHSLIGHYTAFDTDSVVEKHTGKARVEGEEGEVYDDM